MSKMASKRSAKREINKKSTKKKPVSHYSVSHPAFDDEDNGKRTKYRKVNADDDDMDEVSLPENEDCDEDDDESLVDPLEELIGTLPEASAPALHIPEEPSNKADDDYDAENNSDRSTDLDSAADGDDDAECASEEDDEDEENVQSLVNVEDPFVVHFEQMLPQNLIESLNDKNSWKTTEETWPSVGSVLRRTPAINVPNVPDCNEAKTRFSQVRPINIAAASSSSLADLSVRPQLHAGWMKLNGDDGRVFKTDLTAELLTVMSSYSDLLFCRRTHENGEDIRAAYCLHILNHALKTRSRILQHNSQLKPWLRDDVPDEFRDRGLARPKTLVLVPFRESALRVVDNLINILLPDRKGNVMSKKRFHDRYGCGDGDQQPTLSRGRAPDHYATFAGNVDDNFRLGITLTKKSMRLYTNFYASDIIVASPLGLRMIVGAKGDSERNFDFLASIEMLVIDQADVLQMQNWEHVTHVLDHLNLRPTNSRGVDFSRVRLWSLEDGWARHYRQSLCFASVVSPEINSLFSRTCCNYAGMTRTVTPVVGGSIGQVVVQLPQVFNRFQAPSAREEPEARFQYFLTKVLPQFVSQSVMSGTLIFVPSYLDFVRVRNHLRNEEASFAQICEYSEPAKIAQARYRFVHSFRRHLLYTERAHFYHRYRLKGIRHLVFYQLPLMPHFYSELCNLTMLQGKARRLGQRASAATDKYFTCTVLFSRYDAHRLAAVVGTDRAAQITTSEDKDVFMFVTGET